MEPPIKFKWKGVHHGYLGLWFIGFGAFFLYMNQNNSLNMLNYLYEFFIVSGSYMVVDDVVEHTITADTPLRIIYRILFKVRE